MIHWINHHYRIFEIPLIACAIWMYRADLRRSLTVLRTRPMNRRLKKMESAGHAPFGVLCTMDPDEEQLEEITKWVGQTAKQWIRTGKVDYGPHVVAGVLLEIMPYDRLERARFQRRRELGYED